MSGDGNPNKGSRFNFRDAVRSVQTALGKPSGSSGAEEASGYEPFPSGLHLDTDEPENVAEEEDVRVVPHHFPHVTDAQLEKLFPLPGSMSGSSATGPSKHENAALRRRQVARAALDEMELNWKLDPVTLGEKSDFNQGCAVLMALLARVRVGGKDDSGLLDYSPAGLQSAEAQRQKREGSTQESGGPGGKKKGASSAAFARRWEAHDLLKAIDQQDHETILYIRDQAMDLLLDLSSSATGTRSGGSGSGALKTPLGYSISLGPKWDSTSIVICGALSKFVNSLPDGEEDATSATADQTKSGTPARKRGHKMQLDPRTMQRLRKLKTNLKLAIDNSLFKDQNNLLASYMQVLIMSEGVGWVRDSTDSVQRALETHIRGVGEGQGGTPANPASVATDCVLQFITVNLRAKKEKASSVNDYISNAVGDLLLCALWQMVLLRPSEVLPGANETLNPDLVRCIPAYIFARDERVAQQFIDRIHGLCRVIDEARLQGDEAEGRRWSRARALSTTSRKSAKVGNEGGGSDDDGDKEGDEDEDAGQSRWSTTASTASQRTIQLAHNRNMRYLKVAEQMADALGEAFRTKSEQRLEIIKQVLKL
ncbi:unnamed protein product [Tilletia controversa]|uniref:Uncharacterized protein n=3 Tax=Tilletia TaxID=13289 RepID=A0A8X7MQU7_9BASI|nr:hypothetical protein CF336_g5624 [Tilletia laevis]KAE8192931.1 hypothetical protein CF328_g5205 [Tilletia controversa]KAE8257008.1 hypothetical protein A4X03_0g4836 [Tilletia caries]KAE8196457.1 hypothetical protein CF335_g4857 [Tilletia laevis]KAE8243847.1 hypothetical protein A4X06_0g6082 [Tilletia controversa]